MGGRHHKYGCEGHERSSTRSASEGEIKRQDCEDGRQGARGLATCRYNAGRKIRGAQPAAAATQAQTATQIAAETAGQTQAKVSTHTCDMVGDSPTQNPESEGTHPARRTKHGRETPEIKTRRKCTAPGNCSDFRLRYGRQTPDFEEGRTYPPTQNDG